MKPNAQLYFAYGQDMDVLQMLQRCPGAALSGRGMLRGYRFVILEDGNAAIVEDVMGAVFGVLWQLWPDDKAQWPCAKVPCHEATVSVRNAAGQMVNTLAFVAKEATEGKASAEYLQIILKAGRAFHFPEAYCQQLEQWQRA